MASPRYCDNPLPHESHEWCETGTFGDGFMFRSMFRCWGVIDSEALRRRVGRVERARRDLAAREAELERWSRKCRRTERQFYEGDDAPAEYEEEDDDVG
jgi:hypothetical protein